MYLLMSEHKTCFQVLINLPCSTQATLTSPFRTVFSRSPAVCHAVIQESEATIHVKERYGGQFKRRIQLQLPIDIENISAEFQAGVLNLILPKTPDAIPRQIPVHGSEKPLVIESHTVEKSKNAK